MATTPKLYLSGEPAADKLLATNPFALLVGMVLDQQVPLEWAFVGPFQLAERLGRKLEAATVAAMPEDDLVALFLARPALHRYPAAMARRVHALAVQLVAEYGGDPAALWTTAGTGKELLARVRALPGFGQHKAKIFVALLGKQFGVRPEGWREAAAPFGGEGTHLSVADIDSEASLALVRDHKRAMKAAAKAAAAPGASGKVAASPARTSRRAPKKVAARA